jgi:5-methylcytosine-specific restriction endonuclease McrA
MSRRWPPKFESLADACVGTKINKASGRMAKHYECASCNKHFPAKEVAVDHIETVVPLTGFTDWDDVIKRMFVEKDGLQVLCKTCHDIKTKEEKQQAKALKDNKHE